MTQYTLVRSQRKTIAIHITKDASVEVRAPIKAPKAGIDKFVKEKENWIEAHIAGRERLNEIKSAFALNYGDFAALCGKPYPIRAGQGARAVFGGGYFFVPPGLTPEDIKKHIIRIYRLEAKRIITNRINEYAPRMNVRPTAIRITGAKTRWGSCSGKNSVNFSWRLIMAENDVIDYVVAHELAHICEHNHSPRFWAVVGSVLQDYMLRRNKLKLFQRELSEQNWD